MTRNTRFKLKCARGTGCNLKIKIRNSGIEKWVIIFDKSFFKLNGPFSFVSRRGGFSPVAKPRPASIETETEQKRSNFSKRQKRRGKRTDRERLA